MDNALPIALGWKDSSGEGWVVTSDWGAVEGRLVCIAVHLESFGAREGTSPNPVTARTWREVPLGDILDRARREVTSLIHGLNKLSADQVEELRRNGPNPSSRRYGEELASAPPEARRIAAELLPLVSPADAPSASERVVAAARVYQDAWSTRSRTPTRDVAAALNVSASAAAKLVSRAREAGLLPPTSRGKAGGLIKTGSRE